jgi:hypothetical protein
VGSKLTLTDATAGGIWSVKNSELDSINAITGVLTAIASGKDTAYYTTSNYCGSLAKFKIITLNALPNAGTISAPSSEVCVNATMTLTDTMHGGVWSRTNSKATIYSSGVVRGVATGMDTVRFVVTSALGCGRDTTTMVITVSPLPFSGPITGPSNICMGTTATLHDTTIGGTWVPTGSGVFVSDSGVVNPFATGVDTVLYVVGTPSCGNDTSKHTVYIQSADNCRAAVTAIDVAKAGFTYYPNPSGDDMLHVSFADAQQHFEVVISDLSGRTLIKSSVNGEESTVNITALRSGIYVVYCYNSDGVRVGGGKLIRQ